MREAIQFSFELDGKFLLPTSGLQDYPHPTILALTSKEGVDIELFISLVPKILCY